jgi:hypothetical protein
VDEHWAGGVVGDHRQELRHFVVTGSGEAVERDGDITHAGGLDCLLFGSRPAVAAAAKVNDGLDTNFGEAAEPFGAGLGAPVEGLVNLMKIRHSGDG